MDNCERIYDRLLQNLIDSVSVKKSINQNELLHDISIEKKELINIYKSMDVDFSSEELSIMDEVIDYCSLYKVFKFFLPINMIHDIVMKTYDEGMQIYDDNYWKKINETMFSDANKKEIYYAALKSQKSQYLDDYLVYYVEGDGNFIFGNNTLRCPIHKFCIKANIYEFLETLCSIDFIRSKYMKSGLKREKCLCYPEDDMCTFRWGNIAEE